MTIEVPVVRGLAMLLLAGWMAPASVRAERVGVLAGSGLEATVVWGARREYRAVWRLPGRVRVGYRSGGDRAAAYAQYEGEGILRRAGIGYQTVRAGQRLVLGRTIGRYPATGLHDGTFRTRPSLSTSVGRPAASAECTLGRWTAAAFAPLGRPATRGTDGRWLALTWRDGGHASGVAGQLGGTDGEKILTAYARWRGPAADLAAELARAAGRTFAVLRVSVPGTMPATLSLYSAPESTVDLTIPTSQAGVRADWRARGAGGRWTVSLESGVTTRPTYRRWYRRAAAGWRHRSRGTTRWECMLRYSESQRDATPVPLGTDVEPEPMQMVGARVVMTVNPERGGRHRARIDYWPPWTGGEPGLVLSVDGRVRAKRFEARWRVTGQRLSGGQRAVIGRPAIGTYDRTGWLYGRGSELALRIGLRVTREVRAFAFVLAGSGFEKRIQFGLELN